MIAVFWAVCAIVVWLAVDTGSGLVGPRKPGLPPAPDFESDAAKVRAAVVQLEGVNLWGVQRNGQPIPPAAPPGEQQTRQISWAVVATVIAKDRPFLLVRVDKEAPKPVLVGEYLPDGSKVLKVMSNAYTVTQTVDGQDVEVSHLIASGK